MEDESKDDASDESPVLPTGHQRATSGSSLLSRFAFMRPAVDNSPQEDIEDEDITPANAPTAMAVVQQHKTRRRRGSLRKVALLGRGAQRERRDSRPLTIDTSRVPTYDTKPASSCATTSITDRDALGLKATDLAPRGLSDSQTSMTSSNVSNLTTAHASASGIPSSQEGERVNSEASTTTDEEDVLQISHPPAPGHSGLSASSGSESYFATHGSSSAPRRRSFQQAKSPLSYSGISTTALPPPDSDWDYSETEWWGWVVLTVTWFVFVMGMGSCLNVWSWAWDVGKTPYAPPELEDDPTLPVVGYYPALIILTGVMAWVWVVVAWVGMKYFRHAKISGE